MRWLQQEGSVDCDLIHQGSISEEVSFEQKHDWNKEYKS